MCLAWLQCNTSESQWLQYFKLVFLEIQNVPLRTVFANPVTFIDHAIQIYVGQKDKANQWKVIT